MQTPPTATPAVSQEAREATNSILRIGSLANEALTTAIIHRACVAYADRETAALNKQWSSWGILEVAVRNQSVSHYVNHWEGRATKAESEVAALKARVAGLELWIREEANHNDTCSYDILHKVCDGCRCHRNPVVAKALARKEGRGT